MKILSVKDNFTCVALEPAFPYGDLIELFKARQIFYADPNNFLADEDGEDRKSTIDAQNLEGPGLYKSDLFHPERTEFLLYKNKNEIIGSATLEISARGNTAWFLNGYIHSHHRGQRLIDIFYNVRENLVQQNSQYDTIAMLINPENSDSIKAAMRNGFEYKRLSYRSYLK